MVEEKRSAIKSPAGWPRDFSSDREAAANRVQDAAWIEQVELEERNSSIESAQQFIAGVLS